MMQNENEEVEQNDKKKNVGKIILLVLVIPILVALGVVIGGYLSKGEYLNGEEAVEEEVEVIDEVTITLDEFILNLEPTGNVKRYIKLELAISTIKEDGPEIIEENINKIRDAVIYQVSSETVDSIFNNEDGHFTLKKVLKDEINYVLGDEIVHDVYISNLMIQ